MKVLIADQINQKGIEELEEVAEVVARTDITPEELVSDIKDFDAIVVRSRTKVTREVIEAAPLLKIIARAGVGVDNVDVEAATEKGVMVVNAPESTSITVAEHTMGLVLSMSRKIAIADKSVKEGKWEKSRFMGMELNGKILGIVGMGRIGSQVVVRSKAFGMDIMVYDPYITPEAAAELGVEVVDLETLLKNADVITIHVPLTPETKYLISEPQFKIMKENAIIVNCARGGIIKEADLYDALKAGEVGGAALDVYETEPPKDNPLLELDNVVLTPHIAASTSEAQRDAAIIVAKEIKKVFQGESPKNVINMPVMDPESFQLIKPFFGLAEKLGKFLIQTAKGNITELNITYCGELAEVQKNDIITRMILQEVLNPILTEPINLVNAPGVAKNRGIIVIEGKRCDSKGFKDLISIKMNADGNEVSVEGVFDKEPKIVMINGYQVDVETEGTMVIVRYKDIPGIIGSIGTKLGEHSINIAKMQVGRQAPGGEAVMVLKVDQKVSKDVEDAIKSLDQVYDAVAVNL
ncbi:phosphoglycerate dehydrogenase [Methanobacterium formicicum]|uniref:D-3-phosphoglycerate dehydrogenase n=1 Tax=Methanobacterium formicicum (strain DSM 3637 / PP1) TaxID=1204725 RepID=K2RBW4_METFP|nr:phosphoglycerate dehydrogenase [Methanobacterium formicicum]EKF85789.1 D-3-phosphoglycerate dehydrogenase [Methanobacterium formicicum DSM 3637]